MIMGVFSSDSIEGRMGLLGLRCESVPTDELGPAVAALACFPMYMVANSHAWTTGRPLDVPEARLPGAGELLEAAGYRGALEPSHLEVLDALRSRARPPDRVFYEYALETLALFLGRAEPAVSDRARELVARGIVRIAASATWADSEGARIASAERAYLQHVNVRLQLAESPGAVEALRALD